MNPKCDLCGREMVLANPNASTGTPYIWYCPTGTPDQHRIAELERELEEAKAATEQPALSCLCCGRSMSDKGRYAAVQHLVFKSVVICQECKGSSEHYSHVLGKYHLADKALIGARMERDAALLQVAMLRGLLSEASLDEYGGGGAHTGMCDLFQGDVEAICDCRYPDRVKAALATASATAQEITQRIEREALEAGYERLMAEEGDWGFEINPKIIRAAILGDHK